MFLLQDLSCLLSLTPAVYIVCPQSHIVAGFG